MKTGLLWGAIAALVFSHISTIAAGTLPAIRVADKGAGRTFETEDGKPFVPFGVNYFRANTGWAPQLWKKWDPDSVRSDFRMMHGMGINCVRVFLSFGSFYNAPLILDVSGLKKFDEFLSIAEENGIYVHPTGPDHWEGLPEWAQEDRIASEKVLNSLEAFWKLFAGRYRNRNVIFAYDLLNEPEVPWETPAMKTKWPLWLAKEYGSVGRLAEQWKLTPAPASFESIGIPQNKAARNDPHLLAFQHFRESLADEWTRRQVAAIKSVAPKRLVSLGLIQWSVPAVLAHPLHYSAFRPSHQAPFLDFMEFHFYPFETRPYQYENETEEKRNLAYLAMTAQEVARPGKPVVLAEFGWYGGGKPRFGDGKQPFGSEEQQSRWVESAIRATAPYATGWLNWGIYDQPEATDASEFIGLLKADGTPKALGRRFPALAAEFTGKPANLEVLHKESDFPLDACITDPAAGNEYRNRKIEEKLKAK